MITSKFDVKQFAKTRRPDVNSELGTTGAVTPYFKDEFDNPSIDTLERMLRNDGTVVALYRILTLPILANTYRFDPDPEDKEGSGETETHPQRDFVEANFTLPPHRGGMTTPLQEVIARMLRANLTGYQPFEKVWAVNEDRKLVYKKIAPRPANGVEILKDDNGGFAGIKQAVMKSNKYQEVIIPTEKALLFTINKDEDPLIGASNFRAAYYHYDKKHRLYYLYELQAEKGAIPPKVLSVNNGNKDSDEMKAANLAAIEEFGINTAVLVPEGYTLDSFDLGKGRLDPMPGINHHNAEMARSVLAQAMLLGTEGRSTGSYALSESHQDMLVLALKGVMNSIEQTINFYLIPQLHEYNFDPPRYCEFHFNDITDDTKDLIIEVFTKIIEKAPNGLPQEFVEGLVSQVAEKLGIEVTNFQPGNLAGGSENPQLSRSPKKELAASQWRRPLTDAESRVDFAAIENKMDTLESDFNENVRPVFNKVVAQAIDDLQPILKTGAVADLKDFKLKFPNEYRNALKDSMNEAYLYGKKGAATEIETKVPATPQDSKDFIFQTADQITQKQFSDLEFIIKAAVTSELHKGQFSKDGKTFELAIDEVVTALQAQFDKFFNAKIVLTGAIVVAEGINRARDDVFTANKRNITSYQYSAILDRKTCGLCESLDGTTVEYSAYKATRFVPPLHQLCRCIWVAILKDDPNQPEITDFPDNIDQLIAKYQTLSREIGDKACKLHSH